MCEITIDEILERGIKLPEDRFSFNVDEFEKYEDCLRGIGGVYTFTSESCDWLYVGISVRVVDRIRAHVKNYGCGNTDLQRAMKDLSDVKINVYREPDLSVREFYENYLILRYNPKYNISKKSKHYEGVQIKKYPSNIQEEVIGMYQSGATANAILKVTGISTGGQNYIITANSKVRMSKVDKVARNDEIVKLSQINGLTAKEIGERFNLTTSAVITIIKKSSKKYQTICYFAWCQIKGVTNDESCILLVSIVDGSPTVLTDGLFIRRLVLPLILWFDRCFTRASIHPYRKIQGRR